MPSATLPFGNLLASGHEVLAGAMPAALNVAVDGTGTVRRRPGIQTVSTAPSSAIAAGEVDGIHVTPLGKVYAVAERSTGNRALYVIASGAAALQGDIGRPGRSVFADTEALLLVANGGEVFKSPLAGGAFELLGGSPPSKVSHVIFNASRVLCNDLLTDRSKVNYSGPAIGSVITGHEQWGGTGSSGFFSAEARPDPVVALGENANEVFVWGSTNLEIYGPDPLLRFSRVATRDYGCVAPYSVTRYDAGFAWLDHRRRVIRSDGRQVQPLSEPIDSVLDGLGTVSDAWGCRVSDPHGDHLVMTFPSSKLTLALQEGGGWAQWSKFEGGQHVAFPMASHAHDPVTDTNFVGLDDGRVCQLVDGAVDDLGTPIVAHVDTGFQDHGTSAWKENKAVHVTLRRGTYTKSTPAVCHLQWQDRPGAWSTPRPIYLGDSGDTYPVVTLRATGMYRQRNWRFTFSENADLALVKVVEDFQVRES